MIIIKTNRFCSYLSSYCYVTSTIKLLKIIRLLNNIVIHILQQYQHAIITIHAINITPFIYLFIKIPF